MDVNRIEWRKASYSTGNGGACVEVGIEWRKASYSTGNGGNCVEVGAGPHLVAVRDSKDPDGPRLAFSADAWGTFIRQIKRQRPGQA
jgi:hypothetical protein